ncbi:MAG: SPASM domain-containing protein [Desulfobacteraceae bacterium]|nr:SPASM domain-containing protein [Desulfobacteraceae bacterium]
MLFKKPLFFPKLDWVQIEVSSFCNASCIYCPQTIFKEKIKRNFIDEKAVDSVLSELSPKTYIHLQGWGEPFLNPDFLKILKKIKSKGFMVGTTTNATLLNDEIMEAVVDLELDYLAVSTAGLSSFDNDFTRKNTSLSMIEEKIWKIKSLKTDKNKVLPKIHLANIALKSSADNFFLSEQFLKAVNPDQVVLSSLSLCCTKEMEKEAFLSKTEEEFEVLKSRLSCFKNKTGIDINYHLVSPFILKERCSENIEKTLFIGSDGRVFPCVFLGVPVEEGVFIYERGIKKELINKCFGNIYEESLTKIWNKKDFRKFRKKGYLSNDICSMCLKRSIDYGNDGTEIMPQSLDAKWELVRQFNRHEEDRVRLIKEAELWKNNPS